VGDDEQYTQQNRLLSIETPLGKDVLLLQGLAGHEGVSSLFSYELELLAPNNDSISFGDIVGQNVSIAIQLPDGTPRYINGYVSRFAQSSTDKRYFTHYHAQMVPWLWFLTRQADCRIFQNMTAPDIISQVFSLFSFSKSRQSLTGTYPTLEYCVQYRETAFNFVSRLMEEYGIFYYFDHSTKGQHTLVLKDSCNGLQPCPNSRASYETVVGGLEDPEIVSDWHFEQELETGKYTVTDYNFTTPSTSLLANEPTVVSVSPNQDLEVFDYPGLYATLDQGTTVAKVRMQEEEGHCLVASGSSNCRGFMSGYTFQLQNHYRADQNTTYVLTEVQHVASAGTTYVTAQARETESYANRFTCIPSSAMYRPARVTRKPFVQGPQPALVVGKSGEEIWVDQYGRVKVQFYWDRLGQKNENSSCWIRVSQPWAGKNWGAMFIPRIGQEVIVSFLEGDPDRPIITGRVYNAEQMPPGTLPDRQTVSGIRTRSTKGGGEHDANVIAFDDEKGQEVFYMRAQKNMAVRVEHDSDLKVGNDETRDIGHDRKSEIHHDDTMTIDHDKTLTVMNNRTSTIEADDKETVGNNQDITIGASQTQTIGESQTETIGESQTLTVGESQTVTVGESQTITAGEGITTTAGAEITVTAGGEITITAGGEITITAPMVTVTAAMASFAGVVECSVLIAESVVSPAYTPGVGNMI
jgi:type VI secretion system secreted protein VgrG